MIMAGVKLESCSGMACTPSSRSTQ